MTPSLHDRVLYHPAPDDHYAQIGNQPLAAFVVGVWGPTCVNLVIFDANGLVWNRTSVTFIPGSLDAQAEQQMRQVGRWCEPLQECVTVSVSHAAPARILPTWVPLQEEPLQCDRNTFP